MYFWSHPKKIHNHIRIWTACLFLFALLVVMNLQLKLSQVDSNSSYSSDRQIFCSAGGKILNHWNQKTQNVIWNVFHISQNKCTCFITLPWSPVFVYWQKCTGVLQSVCESLESVAWDCPPQWVTCWVRVELSAARGGYWIPSPVCSDRMDHVTHLKTD